MPTTAIVSGAGECAVAVSAECLTELGIDVRIFAADAGDPASVAAAVERLCAQPGGPTVLVSHLGGAPATSMTELSITDWDDRVGGQLRLLFRTCRAVIDSMVLNGGGRIVTVVEDDEGPVLAAVEGFVRTIALELEPFGITANVIVPQARQDANLTATLSFLVSTASVTGQIFRVGA